nr:PREDICTED: protein D1-like isoform X1 [Bemisia tabaci]
MAYARNQFLSLMFSVILKPVRVLENQKYEYDQNSLKMAEIIPDVIDFAPEKAIKVIYPNNVVVNFGNNLSQSDISAAPSTVEWSAVGTSLYTLIMTDPDVPCRKHPTQREWVHWLISNIPGNEWKKGSTVCRYINPPKAVDGTRYVFLVYLQPNNQPLQYEDMEKEGSLHRLSFSVREFSKKYSLGEPIAVNFFEIPYNDAEKMEERKRNEQIRHNRKHPPTRTTTPTTTTESYLHLNNPHASW